MDTSDKFFFLVDIINHDYSYGAVQNVEKVNYNIEHFPVLKESINTKKEKGVPQFSIITVVGRWIVLYQNDSLDNNYSMMFFIDHRSDVDNLESTKYLPNSVVEGIKNTQKEYLKVFNSSLDTVYISYAEVYEHILKDNLFICNDDSIVKQKAIELGVMPMLEYKEGETNLRSTIIDENFAIGKKKIRCLYAIINFGDFRSSSKDNGFSYIRIFDFPNNYTYLEDLFELIRLAGGNIDRAYFINRFSLDKMN